MPIIQGSGTLTSTVGTEQTLLDLATPTFLVYMAKIDLTNMISGDIVILNIYNKVLSGGNLTLFFTQTYNGVQNPAGQPSVPLPADQEIKFTLYQTAGSPRTYPWTVISLP